MEIINNPRLKKRIERVARWIIEECDEPISEVEWLLKKLYVERVEWVDASNEETMILTGAKVRTLNEDIDEEYSGLFEGMDD